MERSGGVGPGEARKPLGTFWFGGLWSSVEWATFTNFLGSWHSWQSPLRRDIPSTDVLLTATQTVHRAILQGTGRQRAIQRDTEGIRHDVKPTTKPCLPEESRFVRTMAAKSVSPSPPSSDSPSVPPSTTSDEITHATPPRVVAGPVHIWSFRIRLSTGGRRRCRCRRCVRPAALTAS